MAALTAGLPQAARALPLTEGVIDNYAGLATVTITRSAPTPAATATGSAAAISGRTTFVMAWNGGDDDHYAASVGSSRLAIDFGPLLAGHAPVSLGRYVFDLSAAPMAVDPASLDLGGPSVGDVADVLELVRNGGAYSAWGGSETQGVFTASYRLFLVDAATVTNPSINAVPEPAVLALIGIGLVALAVTRRSTKP